MFDYNDDNTEIFDEWNIEKKNLHRYGYQKLTFYEGEIWWCSIGKNLGREQDGKNNLFERPALVLRKFNEESAWVLPMSSKIKKGKYYFTIECNGSLCTALLSQIRFISTKRFRRIFGKISLSQLGKVREKIKHLL